MTFKVVQQAFPLHDVNDIRVPSLLKALFESAGSLTVSAESSIYNCARGVDGFLFFRFLSTLMPSTGQIVLSRHRFSTGTTGSSTWFLFTHDARRVDEFLQWQSRSRFTNATPTINLTRLKLRYKAQMAVY